MFGSQPEDLGALPGAGAFFITFYSSKVEHPVDNRETEERYLVQGLLFGCLAERD